MNFDDFKSPLIVLGVCAIGMIIVFCANALLGLASAEEGPKKNKVKAIFVWTVIIVFCILAVLTFSFFLKLNVSQS